MVERHLRTFQAFYIAQAAELLGIEVENKKKIGFRLDVDPEDPYYPEYWDKNNVDPNKPSVASHVLLGFNTDDGGYKKIIEVANEMKRVAEEEGVRNPTFISLD